MNDTKTMNVFNSLVAAGILPAVEPWLPARRKWLGKIPNSLPSAAVIPVGKMPAF